MTPSPPSRSDKKIAKLDHPQPRRPARSTEEQQRHPVRHREVSQSSGAWKPSHQRTPTHVRRPHSRRLPDALAVRDPEAPVITDRAGNHETRPRLARQRKRPAARRNRHLRARSERQTRDHRVPHGHRRLPRRPKSTPTSPMPGTTPTKPRSATRSPSPATSTPTLRPAPFTRSTPRLRSSNTRCKLCSPRSYDELSRVATHPRTQ